MYCIVLPLDGFMNTSSLLNELQEILSDSTARNLISHIKLNDAIHMADSRGPGLIIKIIKLLRDVGSTAKIFLDIKLADMSGSNRNILSHYNDPPGMLDILTVRETCSAMGYLSIRQTLPKTKIALASTLTDISQEECQIRFNCDPEIKILNDVKKIQFLYEKILSEDDNEKAFDMVVCSPHEIDFLKEKLDPYFKFVIPGIRDDWMEKGQQARTKGVRAALESGAELIVLGSQMTKGNPEKGVSALESRKRTYKEIQKFYEYHQP